ARTITYCLIPRDLAPRLHDALRRHFAPDPAVEVIVERRAGDRRRRPDRRAPDAPAAPSAPGAPAPAPRAPRPEDCRRVRAPAGRRVAARRAPGIAVPAPPLP